MRQSANHDEGEPDPSRPGPVGPGLGGGRKKGIGVRAWLMLDAAGEAQVMEVGKHAIMRRTGLPARDLRILDPLLSYPSTVLGRERAIVINLEHIKAIITANEVLLLNSKDPFVTPFLDELQRRLLRLHQAATNQEVRDGEGNTELTKLYDFEEPHSPDVGHLNEFCGFPPRVGHNDEIEGEVKKDIKGPNGVKVLPFEFVALEACLEAACSSLDSELQKVGISHGLLSASLELGVSSATTSLSLKTRARTLEQEAHPALDKLTTKISTLNLERVRQIKSRLVAITGRVQKVRDELEHLLDDDEDMAEMYLTAKLAENLENSSISSIDDDHDDIPKSDVLGRMAGEISPEADGDAAHDDSNLIKSSNLYDPARGQDSRRTFASTVISKQLNVEELEMLLEAYFVQIDGTLNTLTTLREYVDDTEDYINIMLDDKQNHLLQMGVMLTTATLVVSAFIVVAGIFGMNIHVSIFDDEVTGQKKFMWTIGGGSIGSILLYAFAIAWCKYKRLLD